MSEVAEITAQEINNLWEKFQNGHYSAGNLSAGALINALAIQIRSDVPHLPDICELCYQLARVFKDNNWKNVDSQYLDWLDCLAATMLIRLGNLPATKNVHSAQAIPTIEKIRSLAVTIVMAVLKYKVAYLFTPDLNGGHTYIVDLDEALMSWLENPRNYQDLNKHEREIVDHLVADISCRTTDRYINRDVLIKRLTVPLIQTERYYTLLRLKAFCAIPALTKTLKEMLASLCHCLVEARMILPKLVDEFVETGDTVNLLRSMREKLGLLFPVTGPVFDVIAVLQMLIAEKKKEEDKK